MSGALSHAERQHAVLGRMLVLDELADLSLYQALLPYVRSDLAEVLRALIPVERKHFEFWKRFFQIDAATLDTARRLRMGLLVFICRMFGASAVSLTLEAIEVHGIRKYLRVWDEYRDTPVGSAVRSILEDEFRHEDTVVSEAVTQRVHPEQVRDIFLGLNDGLVEMLGAISGFFAAFNTTSAVLMASVTVSVAGALSMGAGAFMGASAAGEMEEIEAGRRRFLGERVAAAEASRPLGSAISVAASYFIGALVPIVPVLLGAQNLVVSVAVSLFAILFVSYVVAFLSGMNTMRRIVLNLLVAVIAVAVTYLIGVAANRLGVAA